ncbi:hypothetical protein SMICM304S_09581 [Streptomyces microflavus]
MRPDARPLVWRRSQKSTVTFSASVDIPNAHDPRSSMATPVDTSTILAAQAGDSDAMWTVLEAHEPLLKSLVRTVAPTANAEDAEDLLQEARVALMEKLRDILDGCDGLPGDVRPQRRTAGGVGLPPEVVAPALHWPSTAITVKHALWLAEGNVDRAWTIVEATGEMPRKRFREGRVKPSWRAWALTSPVPGRAGHQPGADGGRRPCGYLAGPPGALAASRHGPSPSLRHRPPPVIRATRLLRHQHADVDGRADERRAGAVRPRKVRGPAPAPQAGRRKRPHAGRALRHPLRSSTELT